MIITKDKEEIKIYLTHLRDLVRATYDSDILTTDDERALNFAIAYIEDRENLKFNNSIEEYE